VRGLTLLLVCLLIAGVVSASDVPTVSAPADTTRPVAPEALRGTEQPLPHHVSPLRHAARGVLMVPYAGVRVAMWPLTTFARLNEQHRLVSRLGKLITFHPGPFRSTIGPLLGYQSSLGWSTLGINVRGRDWLGTGADLKMGLGYVNRRRSLVAVGFENEGERLHWELAVRQEYLEDRPFYGLGPDSPEHRTDYNARLRLVEAELTGMPNAAVSPTLSLYLRDLELRESSSETSMSDQFADEFATSRNGRYAGAEAELTRDTRNARAYSNRGGMVRAQAGRHFGIEAGNTDYWSYEGELQVFKGLMGGSRSLMFRAFAQGVEQEGGGALPISELPRLGGRTGLRGFSRNRFADRRSMLLTAAYRYPVTARVTGEVFVDWGTVAPAWSELALSDAEPSVGMGLMLSSKYGPLLSFHVAGSREGVQVAVGTTSIFKTGSRRKP